MENPDSFRTITPVRQDLFPWTFRDELSWVEPYYARFGDRRLPAIIAPRSPFSEWRRRERGVGCTAAVTVARARSRGFAVATAKQAGP
ncbi:hypothetical protein LGM45_21145 [Burkholderia cepacia]|uniref:hypothetical protein n=1 Tax=Burkholderia cepacia TaxID=292 RepID=UPI001CF412AB|nr:hypothetical protein [Burkholderia cepacia]MCA7931555.1 hypothetical protein [Burkholderia cepacia]